MMVVLDVLRALAAIVVGLAGFVSAGVGLAMATTGLFGAGVFAICCGIALVGLTVWIGPDARR